MIKVNIVAWKNKTEAAKRKIKSSANAYVQAQVKRVLKEALNVSPQYSSDYVWSWRIVTTQNRNDVYSPGFKVQPWQKIWDTKAKMGDQKVIRLRMAAEMEHISDIKWNSKVQLVNTATVHELLESKSVRLRPENVISGNPTVIEHLKLKFKILS